MKRVFTLCITLAILVLLVSGGVLASAAEQTEQVIKTGETLTVDILADEVTCVKFIPDVSGIYTFSSLSSTDTFGYLYDADKKILAYNDDDGTGMNFSVTYTLYAEQTYYLGARFCTSTKTGTVEVNLAFNKSICLHENTNAHEEIPYTCASDGYTAGVYCEDCQSWLSGHKLVVKHHVDENLDILCDVCSAEIAIVNEGACGDNVAWTLYESGVLLISGEGEMWNWSSWYDEYAPWLGYSDEIRRVVIREGITSIGMEAFCSQDSYREADRHFYPVLTEIVIPNTVTTIYTNGISGLEALETIILPESVNTMVGAAINNNYALKQFVVAEENSVYKAVDGVLYSKDGKTLINYPIGSLAETYTVAQGTEKIAAYAFSQCNSALTEVIFNDELTFIDDEAFQNCDGLTRIELPNSLKELGGGVFQECSALSEILLPRGMTRIGGLAFQCTAYYDDWNNWKDNVLYIGSYLVETAYAPAHLPWGAWKVKSGTLTVREGTTLIADESMDSATIDAVEFNEGLQHIGFCAFGWLDLASVTLPDSLVSLGDWAFYSCENLQAIHMGENIQYIGHDVFGETPYDTAENYVDGVLYYGPYVLGFNDDLPDNVVLRDGTKLIAERAFWKEDGLLTTPDYGASMQSIAFPETLTTICDGAFYSCNNLKEVTIPATVTTIGYQAFGWIKGYDTSIDEETFRKMTDFAIAGYPDSAAHSYAVANDIPFTDLTGPAPVTFNGFTAIVEGESLTIISFDKNLVDSGIIEIPESYNNLPVTKIAANVITSGKDITEIIIPASVTDIADNAITSCYNVLFRVVCGSEGDKYCQDLGFDRNVSHILPTEKDGIVDICSGCQKTRCEIYGHTMGGTACVNDGCDHTEGGGADIGGGDYGGGSGGGEVIDPGVDLPLTDGAFTYVIEDGGATITKCETYISGNVMLPTTLGGYPVTAIGDFAFDGCYELTGAKIPNTVTEIGEFAFRYCASLESITIPNNVTSIGMGAFAYCQKLEWVNFGNKVKSIPAEMFLQCWNLNQIVLSKSVVCVDINAFYGCDALEIVNYEGTLKEKEKIVVFRGNSSLQNATWNCISCSGPHTYDNACDADCNECGEIRDISHQWNSATCTAPRTCKICSEIEGSALGHTYDKKVVSSKYLKSAANCSSAAVYYKSCKCGAKGTATFTSGSKLSHTYDKSVATAEYRKFAATCTKLAVYYKSCKCGAKGTATFTSGKALGHKYFTSYTVDKKATCTAAGSKSKHCTRSGCSAKSSVTTIAKTAHKYKTTTTKATLKKNGSVVKKCTVCDKVASNVAIKYVKTFKLSATTYTYKGKVKTPTVTIKDSAGKTLKKNTDYTVKYASGRENVGTYKVTITFKGKYSGTKVLTFKILPKAASVNKLTAKTKAITVKINRSLKQSSGYQIQYATSKSFKSYKTTNITKYTESTKTISGLKAKTTYYVRVRTYKTVGGVKIYSNWSTAKNVKTK